MTSGDDPHHHHEDHHHDDDGWTNLTDTKATSAFFGGLKPWTEYVVAVFVVPTIDGKKVRLRRMVINMLTTELMIWI